MSHLSGVSEIIDFSSRVPIILRRRATDWDQSDPILDKLLSGELRCVKTVRFASVLKDHQQEKERSSHLFCSFTVAAMEGLSAKNQKNHSRI
jgi:hypothetical protein